MNTKTLTITIPDVARGALQPGAQMSRRAHFELEEVDADLADIKAAHDELGRQGAELTTRRHAILRIIQENPDDEA